MAPAPSHLEALCLEPAPFLPQACGSLGPERRGPGDPAHFPSGSQGHHPVLGQEFLSEAAFNGADNNSEPWAASKSPYFDSAPAWGRGGGGGTGRPPQVSLGLSGLPADFPCPLPCAPTRVQSQGCFHSPPASSARFPALSRRQREGPSRIPARHPEARDSARQGACPRQRGKITDRRLDRDKETETEQK